MKVSEKLSVCFLVEKSEMSKDGRAPIYARFTLDGQRKEFSLGTKIFPDQWDAEGCRVFSQSPEALLINAQITQAKARLEKQFLVLSAQFESITADMLKRSYQGKTVKGPDEEEPEVQTLIEALDCYINRFKEKVDKCNRSVRTLRKWNTTRDKVSGFLLATYRKRDIALKAVKPGYAEDIYHYLTTQDGLSHNSAMKYIKNIRQVFRFAVGRWITANPFTAFICSYLQPNRDCLTMPEIVRLYHQPMIKRLDRIRDVFYSAALPVWLTRNLHSYRQTILLRGVMVTNGSELTGSKPKARKMFLCFLFRKLSWRNIKMIRNAGSITVSCRLSVTRSTMII